MTGFRTLSEFYEHTNAYERTLIMSCLRAYADEREQAASGGGSGGPPGL